MSAAPAQGDLSVTALYTSATWAWAKLPGAELLDHPDARRVFEVTNAALGLSSLFGRGPSLKASLVQRHLIIDGLLAESGTRHVLELAAGLSRRGAHVSADPAISYTEVDRPAVLSRKRELLARSEAGRQVLARPNLRLLDGDVRDAALEDLATGGDDEPLMIIAEGLLMYLDAPAQRALWSRVGALLARRGGALVFDLVPACEQPPPGAAGRALGWLMRRFTGGAGFERDTRTRGDLLGELSSCGLAAEWLEPTAVLDRFQLPFRDVRTQQLVFVACRSPSRGSP